MIRTLILKDFRIIRRNWAGLAIHLALPLLITALIGSIFGPSAKNEGLPTIRLAVVDEDGSYFGQMFRNALGQEVEGKQFFDAKFLSREEALASINENRISAVIVVPAKFTNDYLNGRKPAPLELIKNPAQSFLPAIVEELMSLVTEALNALSVNLAEEVPDLIKAFDGNKRPDFVRLSQVMLRIGGKFERAEDYLFPPIISYGRETKAKEAKQGDEGPAFNIFAFLLPGLTGMFLLFIADLAVQGLFAEREHRTLDRFRTLHPGVMPVLIAKAVYGIGLLGLSAFILMGLGALVFRFHWQHAGCISALVLCYSVFCVGFIFLVASWVQTAQRASIVNSMIIMFMSFMGGSMMPVNSLPPAFRNFISPCFPNYWFIEGLKSLQFGRSHVAWLPAMGGLLALGIVCLAISSRRFNQLLTQGVK